MAKKVKCHCGCGSLVSASTERRHRAGKATLRVKASHAAQHTIYTPKHLPPTTKKRSTACLHSEHLSAPEIFSQPPDNANMHLPDDIANRHPDGGTLHVPTSEGAQGTEPVDYDNWDGGQVSEALANVREEAWRQQYPVIAEDYSSDDENNQDRNCDDDDGFDWHAEMCGGDEMDVDDDLEIEDSINQDFERELAEFGKASPLT